MHARVVPNSRHFRNGSSLLLYLFSAFGTCDVYIPAPQRCSVGGVFSQVMIFFFNCCWRLLFNFNFFYSFSSHAHGDRGPCIMPSSSMDSMIHRSTFFFFVSVVLFLPSSLFSLTFTYEGIGLTIYTVNTRYVNRTRRHREGERRFFVFPSLFFYDEQVLFLVRPSTEIQRPREKVFWCHHPVLCLFFICDILICLYLFCFILYIFLLLFFTCFICCWSLRRLSLRCKNQEQPSNFNSAFPFYAASYIAIQHFSFCPTVPLFQYVFFFFQGIEYWSEWKRRGFHTF